MWLSRPIPSVKMAYIDTGSTETVSVIFSQFDPTLHFRVPEDDPERGAAGAEAVEGGGRVGEGGLGGRFGL